MAFDKKKLSSYPKSFGVYLMKDKEGNILYVGKAKNLRSRIKQYFAARDERIMLNFLLPQVEDIETIVVTTEKEALLLENTLIKKHKPKYNILLKDDKTFISLMITDDKWPMIKLVRYKKRPEKDKSHYFGPYTNARAARQTLDLISYLFPLRQCSDIEFENRSRPCILYDIKRCIAPCVGKCTHEKYIDYVEKVEKLLKGKDKQVLKELETKMHEASDKLEYEQAEGYKQLIHQIKHVTQVQHVDNQKAKECDVLAIYRHLSTVVIAQLMYRNFKLIGSNHFTFSNILSEDTDLLASFLLQHYPEHESAKEIIVPFNLSNKKQIEEILTKSAKKKITITYPRRGEKKKLLLLAKKNAKALFDQEKDQRAHREKLLLELQENLCLTHFPRHIDCFDISHIAQSYPVGAKISFINGQRDKSKVRFFKVKIEEMGDCPALRHVLRRHFIRAKEENRFPDLLMIDGAKAQLNAALAVLEELDIASVDVIAITKEAALHTKGLTKEKIYIPERKDPIIFSSHSPMLFFLQKVRDEAHRVAISFHRKTRSKKTIKTTLIDIPGIGPSKSKKLLQEFKSLENLKKAKRQDLENLAFISKKDIENILSFFKK